jgi:hypothetical protein
VGKRSKVWDEFYEVFEMRNGEKVRVQATCKHCGKVYSGLSTGGVTSWNFHRSVSNAKMWI